MKEEKALHVLIDVCFNEFSDSFEKVDFWVNFGKKVLDVGEFKILKSDFHKFTPFGLTGFWLLSESHFALHTWPENRHICFDLFSCGEHEMTKRTVDLLTSEMEKIGGKIASKKEIERGFVYKK